MRLKSKVLIIAGSDSSGGAGIQADIKTVTALGSYAMTAITAVTSQNTTGVKSISSITPIEISKQIEFTSKDIKPDAIKIGMLHSEPVINSVIKSLNKIKIKSISMIKRHTKPNPNAGIAGGVVEKDASIDMSNISIFNSSTKKADKISIKSLEDGKKIRVFRSSGKEIK